MTAGREFWIRHALLLALVIASTGVSAGTGFAASEELKCQDAIAVSARNYFKDRFGTISKCEGARIAGKFDAATNCRPNAGDVTDGKTAAKLSKSAAKLSGKITGKCSDTVAASLTLGLPCGTVAAASDIVDCIIDEAHGANADLLIETAYDSTGLIEDKGLIKCQKTIAKEAQGYAKQRMTARRGCGKKVTDGKQTECPDAKTRAKLAKALDKFKAKVLGACTDAQVTDAAIDFGFPCDAFAFTTFVREGASDNAIPAAERLARCVAAAAAGDADLGAGTVYPLPDAAPFSFGVAAGDATESAFVAWTRTDGPGDVSFDVATDPLFISIIGSADGLVPSATGDNTVKVDVSGLSAATQYFYRFRQGDAVSRVGRVRTAPVASSTGPVRFAWTGDANAFFKPYNVLEGIIADDPDLFLFIGDTIYGDDPRSGTGVATVRSDYHVKYRENRSDRSLRDVTAAVGTVTIWDDHEVTNDFYGTDPAVQEQMVEGTLAFLDYMPIRDNADDGSQLYRNFQWGQAAEFFLIDDRQYRSGQAYVTEPACLGTDGEPEVLPNATCQAEIDNPDRTYLGDEQKQWLKDGLLGSTATFKFIMNGPLISNLIFLPYDRWEGYTAERTEMIDFIKENDIRNVIFLSTDIHAAIVNDAVGDGSSPVIRELVAGAIGMDPIFRELPASIEGIVPTLPGLFPTMSYFDIDRFNYGLIDVTTSEATVTYRDNTGGILNRFVIAAE